MDDQGLAIVETSFGAAGRTGAVRVETVCNGSIRLAVSHTSDEVDSYSGKGCTGLELTPALWRRVIAEVQARLPAEDKGYDAGSPDTTE